MPKNEEQPNNSSKRFLHFLKQVKSPYLLQKTTLSEFQTLGYQVVEEFKPLEVGKKYVIIRDNALCLLNLKIKDPATGFKIAVAHSDFPTLKIKPNSEVSLFNYLGLAVEIYGAPILSTWFDRNLSLSGQVYYEDKKEKLNSVTLDFNKPIAFIPSLAVHLDRITLDTKHIDKQADILPIIAHNEQNTNFLTILANEVTKTVGSKISSTQILDYDLSFYDTQEPILSGFKDEFISSQGLDNLLSTFSIIEAFKESAGKQNIMAVIFDHEEIGSSTAGGAASNFIENIMRNIFPASLDYSKCCRKSSLLSVDNTNAVHPVHSAKHDSNHQVLLNQGVVFKYSTTQRYATNHKFSSRIKQLLDKNSIPFQNIVANNNVASGSTVGPFLNTKLAIPSLDIGLATLGMHSIREVCGTKDLDHLIDMLQVFYQKFN